MHLLYLIIFYSGCRADVVRTKVMTISANLKVSVCGFDFGGCGQSEGHYVRLPECIISNIFYLYLS